MPDLSNKDVNMNFRISEDLRDRLKATAQAQGTTPSKLLRNYIEELVGDTNDFPNVRPTVPDEEIAAAIRVRCSKALHSQFFLGCEKAGQTPSTVLRAFMQDYSGIVPKTPELYHRKPFAAVIIYLLIFLQNEMVREGYQLLGRQDISTQKVTSKYPLILEIPTGDSSDKRIWQIYDDDKNLVMFMTFHKLTS